MSKAECACCHVEIYSVNILLMLWWFTIFGTIPGSHPRNSPSSHMDPGMMSCDNHFNLTADAALIEIWANEKYFGFKGVTVHGTLSPTFTWPGRWESSWWQQKLVNGKDWDGICVYFFGWNLCLTWVHQISSKYETTSIVFSPLASQTTPQWFAQGNWLKRPLNTAPNWADLKLSLSSDDCRSFGLKVFTFGSATTR